MPTRCIFNATVRNVSVCALMLLLSAACGVGPQGPEDQNRNPANTEQSNPRRQPTWDDGAYANLADKSTALGRLCWVDFELTSLLLSFELTTERLDELSEGKVTEDPDSRKKIQNLKALMAVVPEELGSSDGLSPTVKLYRDQLSQRSDAAEDLLRDVPDDAPMDRRLVASDALADVFDQIFLDSPGGNDFRTAAQGDSQACPQHSLEYLDSPEHWERLGVETPSP